MAAGQNDPSNPNTDNAGPCGCDQPFDPCKTGNCEHGLPQVTFSTFIMSLSSSALVHLGEIPDPDSNKMSPNLPMAKHTIDTLAMLKDKTVKCLDDDERRLIEGVLYDLRMQYVVKCR